MRLATSITRFFVHLIRFSYWVGHDFYVRNGFTRAGSLAYNLLLSFVPFVVITISVVSFFPIYTQILSKIELFILSNFLPHTVKTILGYLNDFQTQAASLPWISFVFLFVTCIMMLMTVESNVNEMWEVTQPRRWGFSLLLHWGLMTLGPLLLCASILMTSFIISSGWFKWHMIQGLWLLPYIFSTLAFTFLYVSVPGCEVRVRQAFFGGIFASVLFELAKFLFTLYTEYFSSYTLLYGALAIIPLFLIWLYVCSFIFLLGAQVVHALRRHQAYKPLNSAIHVINNGFIKIENFYNKTFQESDL
jgi:membrane protein